MSGYNTVIPPVIAPAFGTLGLPAGTKETGQRADFRPDAFTINIEGHGYRLAWTRATLCPCTPLNTQTKQSNPNCSQCHGSGYFYFGDTTAQDISKIGQLNDAQKALIARENAYIIRGIMTALSTTTTPFEKIGGWRTGVANLTVRAENKIAYYDRLVAIDSTIAYSEVVTTTGLAVLPTRYIVDGGVNLLMDANFRRYLPGADFTVKMGAINWIGAGPAKGTRITAHYFTHPVWLVTSYPHTVRNTYNLAKQQLPVTPEGNFVDLPLQAVCQLEFLVGADEQL